MIWNGGEAGSSAPLIAAPRDLPNRKFLAELDHLPPSRDPPSLIHDIHRSGLEEGVIYFHNVGAPVPWQGCPFTTDVVYAQNSLSVSSNLASRARA